MRMCSGLRPVVMISSSRRPVVRSAFNDRRGRVANALRVNSSMTLQKRSAWPSTVRSCR